MKRISSYQGGRFIVITLLSLCLLIAVLCVVGIISNSFEWICAIPLSLLMLFAAVHRIKSGFLSSLQIDEIKIANADYSLNWDNVYITLATTHKIVYANGIVDIMYIDDHYLSEDEINNKTYKMFMVVTPLMPKRQELILSRYNKIVRFINQPNEKRHDLFLKHNERHNQHH